MDWVEWEEKEKNRQAELVGRVWEEQDEVVEEVVLLRQWI